MNGTPVEVERKTRSSETELLVEPGAQGGACGTGPGYLFARLESCNPPQHIRIFPLAHEHPWMASQR